MSYLEITSYLYRQGRKHESDALHIIEEIDGHEVGAIFRGCLCDAVMKEIQPFEGREEAYFFNGEFDQKWFSNEVKENKILGFLLPYKYHSHFMLVEEEPEEYDPTRDIEFQHMAADMLADVGDADGAWSMMGDMGMYEGQTYIEEKYFNNDIEEEPEINPNLKLVKKTGS